LKTQPYVQPRLRINRFACANFRLLYSNPMAVFLTQPLSFQLVPARYRRYPRSSHLGVTCHPYSPCEARQKTSTPQTHLREHQTARTAWAGIATLTGQGSAEDRDRKARLNRPGSRPGSELRSAVSSTPASEMDRQLPGCTHHRSLALASQKRKQNLPNAGSRFVIDVELGVPLHRTLFAVLSAHRIGVSYRSPHQCQHQLCFAFDRAKQTPGQSGLQLWL
jgi:hypothetical protein